MSHTIRNLTRFCKNLRNSGAIHQSVRHESIAVASISNDLKMTSLPVKESDKELYDLLQKESTRQQNCLNLSPLENYAARATLDTVQTVLQNKYSEGYPHERYYGGNEYVDMSEEICQERALSLFNLSKNEWHANVQTLSGAPACLESLTATISPGDRILAFNSRDGGDAQLGGSKKSALHDFFNVMLYNTNEDTQMIDYNQLSQMCSLVEPDVIITGNGNSSGYPRRWDFDAIKNILSNNTNSGNKKIIHICDISDVAGLIATKQYPSPFDCADIVTINPNTSLRGPRGSGVILCRKELASQIDMGVFPGHQGGPHNHAISALAASLFQAASDEFVDYQKSALENANQLANELKSKGYDLITDGTDTTTVVISRDGFNSKNCDDNNIHVCTHDDSNTVRMSSLAMTTRGLTSDDFKTVADFVDQAAS